MWRKCRKMLNVLGTLLVLFGLLLGVQAIYLEAGICEDGMWECLNDPLNAFMGMFFPVYCSIGYGFCKRYIS